ncbi:MAG: T9SS type A sorting domain-containing protein [Bacteroidales bacterium]|jgi:hypothetical protein
MRYFTLGLLLLFSGFLSGFSQELTISYGEQIVNDDSIYLSGTKSTELIEIRLAITNNRDAAVSLKLRKTEIRMVEGAESSFCWGECYTPVVFVSPKEIVIQSRGCDRNSFVGDYRPFEVEGTSIVKYTFFNPADTSYQQSVTVFYQIGGSGVDQMQADMAGVNVFPNPADGYLYITLSEPSRGIQTVRLKNTAGQVVYSGMIPKGGREISWKLSDVTTGFYFVTLSDDKRGSSTRKIIITH